VRFFTRSFGHLIGAMIVLGGCSADVQTPERYASSDKQDRDYRTYGTFHGGDGFTLWSSAEEEENGSGFGGGLAINPFLWRAALEATNFMPLAQTDPVGGVIISDWYSPPETPDERFKLTVYVLDRELRADAVKVSVFRQMREADGWRDAAVDPATAGRIEDNILTLARELRVASLDAAG
jgi:hypothetical protein